MGPSASWELLAKNAPGHPAAFVDPRVSASLTSALRGQPREAQIDAGEVGLSSALSRVWSFLLVVVESCFFEQIAASSKSTSGDQGGKESRERVEEID
ncbi:hypothetical protein OPV22_001882 [Ensete ventricosum]|uniref:Uncharacterized protein n=1 Tax=Ensete ventricosum TaxID=4639 RepID=A0AAV8RVB2_ENSVE|nr:hypothetical protein OPV22_001882 [Ensete ventricosum]